MNRVIETHRHECQSNIIRVASIWQLRFVTMDFAICVQAKVHFKIVFFCFLLFEMGYSAFIKLKIKSTQTMFNLSLRNIHASAKKATLMK